MFNRKNIAITMSLLTAFSILTIGCGSGGSDKENVQFAPTEDATEVFSPVPEYQRLWYFPVIGMGNSRNEIEGLDGNGVEVTIMAEEVDASHPDLKGRINKQYNTFATKDRVLEGEANQPYGFDKMGYGDGHGTHIAGTIAANCDDKGVQGVACGTVIDVYDIGAYDSGEKFKLQGWEHPDDDMGRFLYAFHTALDDVTKKAKSHITTGSFNIESPYIPLVDGGELEGKSIREIQNIFEKKGLIKYDKFINSDLFSLKNEADKNRLKSMLEGKDDNDRALTLMGTLLSKSKEWKLIEDSISEYQKAGGVYIVTESNNIFNETSILNAMPTISDKVDKDLWISAVLISPKGLEDMNLTQRKESIQNAQWENLINDCGKTAKEYCLLVPSRDVLSTVTQKVREAEYPLVKIDDGYYQSYTGHSMGAPMIAGALALMEQKNEKENLGYNMKDLVKILKENANKTFKGYNPDKHGQGILDIKKALTAMTKK